MLAVAAFPAKAVDESLLEGSISKGHNPIPSLHAIVYGTVPVSSVSLQWGTKWWYSAPEDEYMLGTNSAQVP